MWERTVKHQSLCSYEVCHFAHTVGYEKLVVSGPRFGCEHLFRPFQMLFINTNDSADPQGSYSDLAGVRIEKSMGGVSWASGFRSEI